MTSKHPWRDKEKVRSLYWDKGKTAEEIADEFGCAKWTVLNWMQKMGIERRSKGHRLDKPATFYTQNGGYETSQSQINGEKDVVLIHRLAAVAWFGLERVKNNEIHHETNVGWDNREEVLTPMEPGEHMRMHNKERNIKQGEDGKFV